MIYLTICVILSVSIIIIVSLVGGRHCRGLDKISVGIMSDALNSIKCKSYNDSLRNFTCIYDLQVFKYFPVEMQSKRDPSFNTRQQPVDHLNSIEFFEGETKPFHFLFYYSLVYIEGRNANQNHERWSKKHFIYKGRHIFLLLFFPIHEICLRFESINR